MTLRRDITEPEFSIAADYLTALRDFAMAKGISASVLLADSDLSLDQLLNPPERVGAIHMNRISANFYQQLSNPLVTGVEFGLTMSISTHGYLGIAAQGGKNIHSVYETVAHYFGTRTNTQSVELNEDDDYLTLRLVNLMPIQVEPAARQFFDLAVFVSILNCGHFVFHDMSHLAELPVVRIDGVEPEHFPHQQLAHLCRVEFDASEMELCVPKAWARQPLPSSNAELTEAAIERCEEELRRLSSVDIISEIRQRIRLAGSETPTLDQLADKLYMSTSTLKRRLKEHGTTYQALKSDERFQLAQELLRSNLAVELISEELGFSDASNFTKAFKKWSGVTPRTFRQQARQS